MPKDKPTYRAAGGLVIDECGRVLLLQRQVVRDGKPLHEIRLPKGHIESGETDPQAALREVTEESGYADLEITADLGLKRSSYTFRGRKIVRDLHLYLMRLRSHVKTIRTMKSDSEEALFNVLWVDSLADAAIQLTYADERHFANQAQQA